MIATTDVRIDARYARLLKHAILPQSEQTREGTNWMRGVYVYPDKTAMASNSASMVLIHDCGLPPGAWRPVPGETAFTLNTAIIAPRIQWGDYSTPVGEYKSYRALFGHGMLRPLQEACIRAPAYVDLIRFAPMLRALEAIRNDEYVIRCPTLVNQPTYIELSRWRGTVPDVLDVVVQVILMPYNAGTIIEENT